VPDSIDINDTLIYTEVDTPASFPGGKPAWIKYVEKNIDASVGIENGAKFGKYKVIIKFVVMKDGTLKNFQPETKYGHGLEQEVIRVLKLSPNWIPAKKNSLKVNSIVRQDQLFILEKG
jgi:protein TonB